MNANRMQFSEPTVRPYVPSPWDALYNFGRQVWLGCVVTFGPRAMHEPAATDDALAKTEVWELVVCTESRERFERSGGGV